MINKKAFTLIELLVVIAIIALLMSILMPALGMAKETARRVICASNLKSIGIGLQLYSQDHDGKMIPNARYTGVEYFDGIDSNYKPWWSYIAGREVVGAADDLMKPFQLGKLFSLQYIEVPAVFYCPTAKLTNDNANRDVKFYTEDLVKFMPPSRSSGWGIPAGDNKVRSNYVYWTWTETSLMEVPNKPIVIDSLVSIAHVKGDRPFGVNALFSGGNVSMTTIAKNPLILDYVNEADWDIRARDYRGFVDALEMLRP